jgi:hypothetical protein
MTGNRNMSFCLSMFLLLSPQALNRLKSSKVNIHILVVKDIGLLIHHLEYLKT